MIHPGYLLNPGDMFQVEPERVLFGTGAWKRLELEERYFDSLPPAQAAEVRKELYGDGESRSARVPREEQNDEEEEKEDEEESTQSLEQTLEDLDLNDTEEVEASDPQAAMKKQLQSLRRRAKELITDPPAGTKVTGSRKQELRAFGKALKSHLSRASSVTPSTLDDLEMQLQSITERIEQSSETSKRARATASSTLPPDTSSETQTSRTPSAAVIALATAQDSIPQEKQILPLPRATNIADYNKPYATPWRPRDYLPAFAFIPRYLEVNQNICSAVYLRHPVCKPGLAEVPTPFSPETMQLAFNYYLRRR